MPLGRARHIVAGFPERVTPGLSARTLGMPGRHPPVQRPLLAAVASRARPEFNPVAFQMAPPPTVNLWDR
jgi:hypothetical protein